MSLVKIALSLAAMALLAVDAGSQRVSLPPASLLPGATAGACLVAGGTSPAAAPRASR